MSNWETFSKVHESREPRSQIVRAISFCEEKDLALELGAGTLIESKYLLENGFKIVTAIDSSPESKTISETIDSPNFIFKNTSFQDFLFEEAKYDLIDAQYSLPFNGPDKFSELIENIIKSLKPKGIFVGQFFGERDGWNKSETKLTFQTKDEALALLTPLEIIEFIEEEKEGTTASGTMKHWHVFHFITRK